MQEIDIKMMQVFVEIYKFRSVSQAAVSLGLSQPTISFGLAKLREHYQDPLFVRTSVGMGPTAFSTQLYESAVDLLASFEAVSKQRNSFDPALTKQAFQIAMTDLSQIVLLPDLLNRLRSAAPGVTIRIVPIDEHTAAQLETGDTDLAVGFMPQLDAGFYQQKLITQHYVGLAALDHPRLPVQPSVEDYLAEGHVLVTTLGTGHGLVERMLRSHGERRIVLEVPSYLGLTSIIRRTDLLATVPQRLAELIVADASIRQFPLPFDVSFYQIKQHWHERSHRDAAHRWLRSLLTELFLEHSGSE
ncbi:LysR family transcriptional regulator [Noviherbaspirillum sedimenti]|uniref:LysR family transcriptional regulator n=1 Tax=Noviherbaspirillum sedimenti TaxID=2320865 RepID=A0A3A3GHK3_9BURK|nr:LysR family transcriptional regulator [Noviherbaspirillum sedimenti]RJG00380.1 LysR family transcriptional regulator [Noviherbaspirillum sedimenti]